MRASDTQLPKWTNADFDSLSWHDCTIHSIGLDQDGDYQSDLVIDLDFLLEWLPTPEGAFQFRLAPALLRFHNVDKLVIRTLLDYKQPMEISEITRFLRDDPGYANFHWIIKLHTYPGRENQIEFDATGFSQELTAQPVLTHRQSLHLDERLRRIREKGEPDTAPSGGSATQAGNSGVGKGSPSVNCSLTAMKTLSYVTGEPVLEGDVVKLGQLDGVVVTVVQTGSPEWDDYGGVSLETKQSGAIRLERIDEDLLLVSRRESK